MNQIFSLVGNYVLWNTDCAIDDVNLTENGDKALSTSGSKCLDFFTRITRGAPVADYVTCFFNAMADDYAAAIKMLLNLRDIRSGKGEKLIPIVLLVCLKFAFPREVYQSILGDFVSYGCWKDLLRVIEIYNRLCLMLDPNCITFDNEFECQMFATQIAADHSALKSAGATKVAISLCAKWAPGEGSHFNKAPIKAANQIRKLLKLTPKGYRLILGELRSHLNVLERLMATGQYDLIDFEKIPSVAMRNMRKSFSRNSNSAGTESPTREKLHSSYTEYIMKLSAGSAKVNVKGTQPHELVSTYLRKEVELDELVEAQWSALVKDTLSAGSFKNTVAVVDTSGSMDGKPLEVAIALGILVAECNDIPKVLTFNAKPRWHYLKGNNLKEKVKSMDYSDWGGNTDLRASFQLILDDAIERKTRPEDMPSSLIIFTDMQFDSALSEKWESTFETATRLFEEKGYKLPKIVCWNLRTSGSKSLPINKNETGYVMISGYSAELLKNVMNGDDVTPMLTMMSILEPYPVKTDFDDFRVNERTFTYEQLNAAIAASVIKKGKKPVAK